MNAHEMRIEFDGRFDKRWLVLCACGYQKRTKKQLEAEEDAASHKNRFGVKNSFEATCMAFADECEALIEKWRKARTSRTCFLPADHYAVVEHCADELEALLENTNLLKRLS